MELHEGNHTSDDHYQHSFYGKLFHKPYKNYGWIFSL